VKIGEQDCRYISTNKYGCFKVDDELFNSGDNEVNFDITYFDDGNNSFELQYNSTGAADKSILITKTNTNQWLTKTIMFTDVSFNNQLNNQSDFRLKGEVYVRSVQVNKPMPSDVSIVFDEQIIENGIDFVIGTNPDRETYTEKATIGEHECRLIPVTDKKKYGYFKVDDEIIKPSDNKLTFEITYFDKGTSPLMLQYISINSNYEKTEITRTNTNTWMTRSLTVTDAAFDNKQNNQADFRIVGESYIRRISIKKKDFNTSVIKQIKKTGHDIKVRLSQGMLSITVPEEMARAEVYVYNTMGQLLYQTKMNQTEEIFHLKAKSNVFIVVVHGKNATVSKKVVAL